MLECRLIRKQVLPMPILHVRNVPEELYEQIRRRAEHRPRSSKPNGRKRGSWKDFAAGASTALQIPAPLAVWCYYVSTASVERSHIGVRG
jgi:hypothetical protein